MTTDEALAVVREALAYAPFNLTEHISHPAYSALAFIEQEMAYYKVSSDGRSAAVTRAEKAEDDLIGALLAIETWTRREQKQYERVRELEAALKKAKVEAEVLREHYTTLVHRHYHAKREAEERLKSAVDEYEKDLAAAEAALQKIEKEAELRSERHIAAIARCALGGYA